MRVLIIGADTPVGLALCEQLEQRGRDHVGMTRADCRWKNERQAKKSLRRSACTFHVDLRLQAAADGGQRIRDIDLERTLWLARTSQKLKVPCLQLSSARVFSGTDGRAYREDDYPNSESALAGLLISAEAALRDSCEWHVILRTGPVFAAVGSNPLARLLEQLQGGGSCHLGRWQQGYPVAAAEVARVVSAVLDQLSCGVRDWGIYHYSSAGETNCLEFAGLLLAAAAAHPLFAFSTVQLAEPQDAVQPRCHRLDCGKINTTFAIKQQPWRGCIAATVGQYLSALQCGEVRGVEDQTATEA